MLWVASIAFANPPSLFPQATLEKPTAQELKLARSSQQAARDFIRKRLHLYVTKYEAEYLAFKNLPVKDSPFDLIHKRIEALSLLTLVNPKNFKEESFILFIRNQLDMIVINTENYLTRIQQLEKYLGRIQQLEKTNSEMTPGGFALQQKQVVDLAAKLELLEKKLSSTEMALNKKTSDMDKLIKYFVGAVLAAFLLIYFVFLKDL